MKNRLLPSSVKTSYAQFPSLFD